jgi:hypothetical protein
VALQFEVGMRVGVPVVALLRLLTGALAIRRQDIDCR